MRYKQFRKWCNDRCFDGCWGHVEARMCLNIVSKIDKLPFWKREKAWKQEEDFIINVIVNPINCMIQAYAESRKIIEKEENENGID